MLGSPEIGDSDFCFRSYGKVLPVYRLFEVIDRSYSVSMASKTTSRVLTSVVST